MFSFWMVHAVPVTWHCFSQVRFYLHPEAKFLFAEPKFDVSDKIFGEMLEIAGYQLTLAFYTFAIIN